MAVGRGPVDNNLQCSGSISTRRKTKEKEMVQPFAANFSVQDKEQGMDVKAFLSLLLG